MANQLFVAPSPHVHGNQSTQKIMRDVIVALLPALAVSTWVFGWHVLLVSAVSIVSCVLFEFLIQKYIVKGELTLCNLSAVVTGLLLAFNLPVTIPWWIVVIGAFVAIGIAKMTYGGLGKNIFNPALAGRIFLLIAYPVQMTSSAFQTDAFTGATPLAYVKATLASAGDAASGATSSPVDAATGFVKGIDFSGMFIGSIPGSLGEVAALALLIGFAYLLWRKVITWHIPVTIFATMAVFAFFAALGMGMSGAALWQFPLFHLLAGGAVLGAVFMATDYVTSPMTVKGCVIYAVGIGVITMSIRLWGSYPEGMSFAIFIMNAVTPLLNKYVKPKRFGLK